VLHRPSRLAVSAWPLPRQDRGSARSSARRRRAAGVRRGRARRLVGDLADAARAPRPRGRRLPDASTRALLARGAGDTELPAEEWRAGIRRPPRDGRSRLRQGGDGGPDQRNDGAGRGAARRPDPSRRPALAVLRAPVLSHRLLAPRDDGSGIRRGRCDCPPLQTIEPMIDLEARDGVAWLRLNRPEALNALDRALTGALEEALTRVAAMDDVAVLVVAGRGRAFCAGNDLTEMATLTGDEAEALATRQAVLLDRFAQLPQVTLAAIDGWALGGGLMLAAAQDLRVASDRARFGLPEVTLGFNPAYGIARLLDVLAGGWARELLLTGRTIHASEALRMGLVNRVVAAPKRAPIRLRLVHHLVGLAEQLLGRLRRRLAVRHPHIAADVVHRQAALRRQLRDLVAHPGHDEVDGVGPGIGEEDRELIAPVAGDEVCGARRLDQRVSHGAEDVVADAVAEAIVDRPQMDHVEDEHQRAGPAPAGHRREAPVLVEEGAATRSEEHTSELQSRSDLVCRLLLEKKKRK